MPMLTDEELTERLGRAFRASTQELEYSGRVPRVRRVGGGTVGSVLAVTTTALALTPAALQHGADSPAGTVSDGRAGTPHATAGGRHVVHTFDLGPLRLTYATVTDEQGDLFLVGPDLTPPPDAEKVDLDIPADVWFAAHPTGDDPQVYIRPSPTSDTYGIVARGWTRQQLIHLLEHPTADKFR
jgi:hypothetical protein